MEADSSSTRASPGQRDQKRAAIMRGRSEPGARQSELRGAAMHFHLPKPLHGWRALLGEVGIIVVGVLIALGAEQLVETWHWHGQAEEARAALRSEVRDDDLPQAFTRLAIAPCLDKQLKQLQGALDANVDRSRFAALAGAYLPPSRTW